MEYDDVPVQLCALKAKDVDAVLDEIEGRENAAIALGLYAERLVETNPRLCRKVANLAMVMLRDVKLELIRPIRNRPDHVSLERAVASVAVKMGMTLPGERVQ